MNCFQILAWTENRNSCSEGRLRKREKGTQIWCSGQFIRFQIINHCTYLLHLIKPLSRWWNLSFWCRLARGFSSGLSSEKPQTHPVRHQMGYTWKRVIDSKAIEINGSLPIGLKHSWIRPCYFQEQKLVSSTAKTFSRGQFFISVFQWWLLWRLNFDTCSDRRASCANTLALQITVNLSNPSAIQST